MKKLFLAFALVACFAVSALSQGAPPWTIQEVDGSPRVNSPTLIKVTNGTLSCTGKTCTITISGGGGGSPGGSSTQVQYNAVGSFGGISGFTSDGTNVTAGSGNLRATRPRFITSIDDTNGNEVFVITATGSAVNEVTIANAATGNNPTFTASGSDANVGINFVPKGSGTIQVSGAAIVTVSATQTLTNKTLTTPTIASFANANHDHSNSAGGGQISIAAGISGMGTGVATALGVNVDSAGAFVVNGGALGTPSSGTLTNATGLPPTTGIVGWPANASGCLSNNGSGTLTWAACSGGGGGITIGTTTITSGTNTRVLYNNAGVVGEYVITGTGNVMMSASPTTTGRLTAADANFTTAVTTGSGTTAGFQITADSLTTGNGHEISSSSVSSGNVVRIAATGTAAASNTKTALNVATSGANATSTQTTYGAQFSNTSTGTSSTNIAANFSASGGSTNYAINVSAGLLAVPNGSSAAPSIVFPSLGTTWGLAGINPGIAMIVAGSGVLYARSDGTMVGSGQWLGFSSGTNPTSSNSDSAFSRAAAAVIRVGQGTASATAAGSLIIGTSAGAIGTSGAGVLAFTLSTEPSTSPTDTTQLYYKDFAAGDGRLYLRNEASAAGSPVANLGDAQTFTGRITFSPGATTAGINVGSVAGNPSAPSNADLWYNTATNELYARINGANVALGSGGGGGITIGTTTITSGTNTRVLYNNSGVVGEYAITGTGNVMMSASPTTTGRLTAADANFTTAVTTGSGTTAGFQITADSLTTGNGTEISSSSVSSGNVVSIAATGTAAASNSKHALFVTTSGANATGTQTTYGAEITNTSTGTSSTNIALSVSASGGTNNTAINVGAGQILVPNGTASLPSYSFTSSATSGIIWNAAGFPSVVVSGTNAYGFSAGSLILNSTYTYSISPSGPTSGGDVFLGRAGAANWRMGNTDAASPVAQTLSVQNVVGGTSNTAGVNWTFAASRGTGTGAGGSIIFQTASPGSSGSAQNSLSTGLSIAGDAARTVSGNGWSIAFDTGAGTGVNFSASSAVFYASSTNSRFSFGSGLIFGWTSGSPGGGMDLLLRRNAAAHLTFGAADAASPVAQTLSVQNVVGGTSNTAGVNWTFAASRGTGTGAGGDIIFQTAPAGGSGTTQNTLATAFTIQDNGAVQLKSVTFANLPTVANGYLIYCSDCTIASPCASGGSGALAKGINGAWVCD